MSPFLALMVITKKLRLSSLFITMILVLGVSQVAAWGNLGHRTVAYLAEKHLTHAGLAFVRSILGDVDISEAAIWADWYKDTPEGKYTGSWHFINGHDDPPTSCDLDLARDCPGQNGCIVTAIMNMVSLPSRLHYSKLTDNRRRNNWVPTAYRTWRRPQH